MPPTADDIVRLFKVKQSQVSIVVDRGYIIPDDEAEMFIDSMGDPRISDESLAAFVKRYVSEETGRFSRDELTNTYSNNEGKTLFVYFAPTTSKDKQGVNIVQAFINGMTTQGVDAGILISEENFTPLALQDLEEHTKNVFQIFYDSEIYANPIDHVVVPEHTLVTGEARTKILGKLRIQTIPVISIEDPIVKYYGWRSGDLIRIKRYNLASEKPMVRYTIAYRIVSDRVKFDSFQKQRSAKVVAKLGATDKEGD